MSNPFAEPQRRMWTAGDYDVIAEHLMPISVETVARLPIGAGVRVLDIAVGSGNAAVLAARRGASVTGIDLTPAQIERARARCAAEGVDVDLRLGDAQALDVDDDSFDVVLSVMGVIFAPDHERACAELARACRPGGAVAVTSWAAGGFSGEWRRGVAHLLPPPPPGAPDPDAWGDADELARRLGSVGIDATVELLPFEWRFSSVEQAMDVFLTAAGAFVTLMKAMTEAGHADEARSILAATMESANEATDGSCRFSAPYLLALGRV